MFIEFDHLLINSRFIKYIRLYISTTKMYCIEIAGTNEIFFETLSEEFKSQDECDARYLELKNLLQGKQL